MAETYIDGGVESTKTGSPPAITKKRIRASTWIKPMKKSFDRGTDLWRLDTINTKPQVVVLSQSVLSQKDTRKGSKSYGQNVLGDKSYTADERSDEADRDIGRKLREFAKNWVKTKQIPTKRSKVRWSVQEQIYDLNRRNADSYTFHYIVTFNWYYSGKFFQAAIKAGLLKEGVTHRGHDTAAVRYHIGSEVDALPSFSERGAGAERVVREAGLTMKRELKAVEDSISPSLTVQQTMNINRELEAAGLFEIILLQPQIASMNITVEAEQRASAQRNDIVNKFIEETGGKLITVAGSKSYAQALNESIDDMLMGKKKKVYKTKKTTKIPRRKLAPVGAKIAVATPPRLRTSKGKFTSTMNIQAILDAKIKETVADNMGKGGALVYRTGRFADSVSVEKVMQSRQGALTAFYTYMKAPYQTFERGYAQGSLRRDPRKLIAASIREIARETLNHKLQIRTRRV